MTSSGKRVLCVCRDCDWRARERSGVAVSWLENSICGKQPPRASADPSHSQSNSRSETRLLHRVTGLSLLLIQNPSLARHSVSLSSESVWPPTIKPQLSPTSPPSDSVRPSDSFSLPLTHISLPPSPSPSSTDPPTALPDHDMYTSKDNVTPVPEDEQKMQTYIQDRRVIGVRLFLFLSLPAVLSLTSYLPRPDLSFSHPIRHPVRPPRPTSAPQT